MLGKEIDLFLEPVQSVNCYQQIQSMKKMNMDLKISTKTPIHQNMIYTQAQEMTLNMITPIPRAMSLIPLNEDRKDSRVRLTSMFPKMRGLVTSGKIVGSRRFADLGGFGVGIKKKEF